MSAESSTTNPAAPEPPATEQPTPPPKRPLARRVLTWTAVVLIALAAFVALLPTLVSTGFGNDKVRSWLAENVEQDVDFKSLDVSWSDGVRLEGLEVVDAVGEDGLEISASLVELDAAVLPLLGGAVRESKFAVHDAVVHVKAGGAAAKKRKPKAKSPHKTPSPKKESDAAEVLPEISLAVEVRNLTIAFTDRVGREARQSGISLDARLETRGGPTTFDLAVPCGAGGGLRVKGGVTFAKPDGTLLPEAQHTADVVVELRGVDAESNRAFLALLLGDKPASGVVNGTIVAAAKGRDVSGDVDVHVAQLGFGAAAKTAASRQGDDLSIVGRFAKSGDQLRIEGWKVRADGLVLDSDVGGTLDALDGRAVLDVDLARLTAAMRNAGVEMKGAVAGKLAGSIRLSPSPSSGVGEFTLTGLRAEGFVENAPPVTIDAAEIRFEAAPGKDRFELKSLDVKLPDLAANARGARAADGTLEGAATVKGDLGGLLARVRDLGFLPGGFSVAGSIDAEALVTGKPDALVVDLKRLALTEKDARIEVAGTRAADGALDLRASGSGDLGSLLGRARAAGAGPSGLGDVNARFAFEATANGPADRLAIDVPKLHVEGDIALDVRAMISGEGALSADAAIDADLASLAAVAKRAGFLTHDLTLAGKLTARAKASGTREKVEVPEFRAVLAGGPAAVELVGKIDQHRVVSATLNASGELDRIARIAREMGHLKRDAATGCAYTLFAALAGPVDQLRVENARFQTSGPMRLDVQGSMKADREFAANGTITGDVQPLLELAAAWSGETAKRLDGKVVGSVTAGGKPDAFEFKAPAFTVRAGSVLVELVASRTKEGAASGDLRVSGPVADLLGIAGAFGFAADLDATGMIDAKASGSLAGSKAAGSLTAVATELVVAQPEFGDGPLREPRVAISVPSATYDLDAKKLDPVLATIELDGATIAATVKKTGEVVSLDGTLVAHEKFAKNHADLLSGASFQQIAGPFQFEGDVSKGRENAATWTGGFVFDAVNATGPHVALSTAKLTGKLKDGVLAVDPIDAVLNGGPVNASATIGLAGDAPAHRLVVKGKDVGIDANLAPLLAYVSPLFAHASPRLTAGEYGTVGGKASIDMELAATGFDSAAIKKSMTGQGTLGLDGAFVQSTGWIGEVLQLAGKGDRFEFKPVQIPFKVRNGKVETRDVAYEGAGLTLSLGGHVDLDAKVDYALRLKAPEGGGGKLSKFAPLFDKEGFLALGLGGTLTKPEAKLPDLKDVLKRGLGGLFGK
jgi:hypothetical protein